MFIATITDSKVRQTGAHAPYWRKTERITIVDSSTGVVVAYWADVYYGDKVEFMRKRGWFVQPGFENTTKLVVIPQRQPVANAIEAIHRADSLDEDLNRLYRLVHGNCGVTASWSTTYDEYNANVARRREELYVDINALTTERDQILLDAGILLEVYVEIEELLTPRHLVAK